VEKHATRLQDLDPLAEEGIRGVMEARAWASDRSSALKAFARYEARLAEELGAKPGPELVRMADLLRDGRRSPSRPVVAGYPPERADRRFEPETLIGREREFSVLYDAWLEARRKNPRIVVVTSDPGVGKTTLVNAFAASCQMEGAVVARAQAYDAERELPFAVLGELVKQLATQRAIGSADPEALSELTRISSEILKAFPGVPKPVEWAPELMPLRIADAFLKAITAAAADSPMILVVDDLHAADNASVAILHSVSRKLTDTRVLLVLAGRSSELRLSRAPWALSSDIRIEGMRALELDVLSHEAADRLVRELTPPSVASDPPVGRIVRAAGRNPLAIELLTREWAEHAAGSLLHDLEALDTQPVPAIGIPRAIGVVFERQTRRLEVDIRATLDLAAILGRRLMDVALYSVIEVTPGQATLALSRLREEGYLRDVSGNLEFRNELIRAQAYYTMPVSIREHLHRRIADLLAQHHTQDDTAINLEIAWHHLRGGSVDRALPFALVGAEAVLAVGAPHGAEEILSTILVLAPHLHTDKKVQLLLSKAFIDQSKAEPAMPIIDMLIKDETLTPHEHAEVAMMRASGEFVRTKGHGPGYCEASKDALEAARRTGDAQLISQALFECARAGTEEGQLELLRCADDGVAQLSATTTLDKLPMALLTKAYCRFFLGDPKEARTLLKDVLRTSKNANAAQRAIIHSGLGLTNVFLGRFEEGYKESLTALEMCRKIGDDARVCTIAANLCTVLMNRGDYEQAIQFGKMSVQIGEACSCSTLLIAYTNLIDPYMLLGRESDARSCLEKGAKWIGPERRWKLQLAFLIEAASFALMQHNLALALDLIGQLESVCCGRELAIPMPGAYWKLKTFRMAQLGQWNDAYATASSLAERWKGTFILAYLDIIATKAWLERTKHGRTSPETLAQLEIFDRIGASGRKKLLTLQGILEMPTDDPAQRSSIGRFSSGASPVRVRSEI
ncbi:MAG TPA: AAA family ATPase, partial [Candidatus Polarisedimenticolia bacterium]|nr:AAA family ATPase [Candidatus Polarisedimenticolia bacterium]